MASKTESVSTEKLQSEHTDDTEVSETSCESQDPDLDLDLGLPLSKNQIKKQKKKEKWLQFKAEKRRAEKEKKKKRFAEMKERGEDLGPSRKSLKRKKMTDSACHQRVVIDCSFDDYMTEKDTSFLVQQIQHSYAANRRAENPLQLYICGIGGKAKHRLDSIGDYKGWDLHKEERDYTEVFPKDQIVYLSSESPHVLDTLDVNKIYVIGGLVDHNHHKGLCHRLAEEKGLAHAQLPIGEFLQLKSRKVLTINHESKSWQKAFLDVLPQRKGICLKENSNHQNSQDSDIGDSCHKNGDGSVLCDRMEISSELQDSDQALATSVPVSVTDTETVGQIDCLHTGSRGDQTENYTIVTSTKDTNQQRPTVYTNVKRTR